MPLRLIAEDTYDVRQLVEQSPVSGKKPSYFIEGVFMQGNKENQNGRIYPTELLQREMARYQKEYIDRKRALGELGHPESPTVNLDRVSHMITELVREGNDFVGRAKIMTELPMGNIVKGFIDEGVTLGVSTRGLGSLRETQKGINEVQDDFFLSTVDIVADPSAPDAFVRGIMENRSWVWEGGILRECEVASLAQQVERAHRPTATTEVRSEEFVKAFQQYLHALGGGVRSNIRQR